MSSAIRCRGVTNNCIKNGQLSCPTIELVRSVNPHFSQIYLAITGGKVNADATVSKSLRKKRPKDLAGNALEAVAPKFWAQALSLAIPQAVFTMNVRVRFCKLRGNGMIAYVSVRLLVVQVIEQTKNIQRNLKELKNSRGWVKSRFNPFFTPSSTEVFPFANSITERSRIALVGEMQKAVTQPARISFQYCLPFAYNVMSLDL